MKLYNKLKTAIEHGRMPITEDKDGNKTIWTSIKINGDLRRSSYYFDLEGCINTLGIIASPEEEINKYEKEEEKLTDYYQPKIKQYEVGQLVDILESARDIGNFEDWDNKAKEMVGQKGLKIQNVYHNASVFYYEIETKDGSDWYFFSHNCLAPHFGEEKKPELTSEQKEYFKSLVKGYSNDKRLDDYLNNELGE